jgi:hypothetical protein
MSSRPWVRIPPAPFRGRSSGGERSLVRRTAAGSSPAVPVEASLVDAVVASWWLWCNGSIRGRDPRGTGSNPVGRPFLADAEHRRAQQAVTLSPRLWWFDSARPHSSRGCSSTGRAPRLQRGRCRFDSDRLHSTPASVVSTASTRPLYGRGAGSTPAGGSLTPVAQWRACFTDSWCNRSMASSNLAGPGANPGEPAGPCCGPETLPLSTPNRQDAGSNPARSIPCSGSSVAEQFGRRTTTAAHRPPRAGEDRLPPEREGRFRPTSDLHLTTAAHRPRAEARWLSG